MRNRTRMRACSTLSTVRLVRGPTWPFSYIQHKPLSEPILYGFTAALVAVASAIRYHAHATFNVVDAFMNVAVYPQLHTFRRTEVLARPVVCIGRVQFVFALPTP